MGIPAYIFELKSSELVLELSVGCIVWHRAAIAIEISWYGALPHLDWSLVVIAKDIDKYLSFISPSSG